MRKTLFALLFAAAFGFAGNASADSLSIDASGCGSCGGLDLYLEVTDNGGSYSILLTYTAPAGYAPADGFSGLNQAGFGAIKDWTSVTLDSVTLNGSDVSGSWAAAIESNISANSLCGNPGSTDKVCTSGFTDLAGGGVLAFEFTVVGGDLKDGWHIGGQRASAAGPKPGQVISEDGRPGEPPIPEPTAALAFGVGALVMGTATRRRRGA